MISSAVHIGNSSHLPLAHGEGLEPRWYAAYTRARHEKKVAEQLDARGVAWFLPLYSAIHRWKDRRMEVQLPLFPGYVFVRMPLIERLRVLEVRSVLSLVSRAGVPAAMPEDEMATLRQSLQRVCAEPYPYLSPGRRVRINSGPLQGLEGAIVRAKGGMRFVVSIELIMRSISIEVDAADLEAAN
jgi:transcription antitermination factor NusG